MYWIVIMAVAGLLPGVSEPELAIPNATLVADDGATLVARRSKKGKKGKKKRKKAREEAAEPSLFDDPPLMGAPGSEEPALAAAPMAAVPVVKITADVTTFELKVKRKTSTVFELIKGQPFNFEVPGKGKLIIVGWQAMKARGGPTLQIRTTLDGKPNKVMKVKARPQKRAMVIGRRDLIISKPKTVKLKLKDGAHSIGLSLAGARAALVSIEFYPKGKRKPLPVIVEPIEPEEESLVAAADTLPPPEPPPPLADDEPALTMPGDEPALAMPGDEPALAMPGDEPALAMPGDEPALAMPGGEPALAMPGDEPGLAGPDAEPALADGAGAAADEPMLPFDDGLDLPDVSVDPAVIEALADRIRRGESRDGFLRESETVTLYNDSDERPCSVIDIERPFDFMVDGPGAVVLRFFRLYPTPDAPTTSVNVAILENDVLLRTVQIELPVAKTWEVDGGRDLYPSAPLEYRLVLAPQLSRFSVQLSSEVGELAVGYRFEAEEKSAMQMSMAMAGDEFGFAGAGGASVEEVVIKEEVIERILGASDREQVFDVSIGSGMAMPMWGGPPSWSLSAEFQYTLPFWSERLAIALRLGYQYHSLNAAVADPSQVVLNAGATVHAMPIALRPSFRHRFRMPFLRKLPARVDVGLSVATFFLLAQRESQGTTIKDDDWVFALGPWAALEVEAGPGWAALEVGYTWGRKGVLREVVRGFRPSAIEAQLFYRYVF